MLRFTFSCTNNMVDNILCKLHTTAKPYHNDIKLFVWIHRCHNELLWCFSSHFEVTCRSVNRVMWNEYGRAKHRRYHNVCNFFSAVVKVSNQINDSKIHLWFKWNSWKTSPDVELINNKNKQHFDLWFDKFYFIFLFTHNHTHTHIRIKLRSVHDLWNNQFLCICVKIFQCEIRLMILRAEAPCSSLQSLGVFLPENKTVHAFDIIDIWHCRWRRIKDWDLLIFIFSNLKKKMRKQKYRRRNRLPIAWLCR